MIRAYRNTLGVNTHVHAAYARMFTLAFIHNKSCALPFITLYFREHVGIETFERNKLRSLRDNLAPIMGAINLHSLQLLHNLGHFILCHDKVVKTIIG